MPSRNSHGRRDAARNREKIVEAARAVFSHQSSPSMDAVARAAGLGRATLYRNFTDLDELSAAIFEANIAALEQSAEQTAMIPNGLEVLLRAAVKEGLRFRALIPALAAAHRSSKVMRLSRRVTVALTPALEAARARGEVRDDLQPTDLLDITAMVFSTVLTSTPKHADRRVHRALDFVLNGIRPRPTGKR